MRLRQPSVLRQKRACNEEMDQYPNRMYNGSSILLLMTYVLLALILVLSANAQECRITAITPAQPPALVEEGERALESQTFQTVISAWGGRGPMVPAYLLPFLPQEY